jgi:hypothetical protein
VVDAGSELPQTLRNADVRLREAAQRQPLLAIGAALIAGYAAGRVFGRR